MSPSIHLGFSSSRVRTLTTVASRMCLLMVGAPGLEPGTGRLKVCCDNHFTILPYGPSGQTWTANQRIKSPLRYHCATKGWIVIVFFYVPSKTIRGSKMTLTFSTFHAILLCWYYAFGLGVLISRTLVSNLSNASTIVEALLGYLFWHLPWDFLTIKQDAYFSIKSWIFEFAVRILNLVLPPGVEPGSTVLQTAAMTASAKVAYNLVPYDRIELPLTDYKTVVLPLN